MRAFRRAGGMRAKTFFRWDRGAFRRLSGGVRQGDSGSCRSAAGWPFPAKLRHCGASFGVAPRRLRGPA